METKTRKTTLKRLLKLILRMPQRTIYTRLESGAVTQIRVFKDRQIIDVYYEPKTRFNRAI